MVLKNMSRQFTRDIQREVSAGRESDASRFAFPGVNNNLPVGIESHLWKLGGVYTYLTTATQLYTSSTDPSDDALIAILGIDNKTDGLLTIRFAQLDGQNKVLLDGLMYRIFLHDFIIGNAKGNIYVYEDDTVIGGVPQTFSKIKSYSENEESGANGIYTIPANATAFVDNYKSLLNPKKRFEINQKFRFSGDENFSYVRFPANPQVLRFNPRFALPARSDIEFTATAKDNNSTITFLVEGVLEFE